jgi:hypothetical protein
MNDFIIYAGSIVIIVGVVLLAKNVFKNFFKK